MSVIMPSLLQTSSAPRTWANDSAVHHYAGCTPHNAYLLLPSMLLLTHHLFFCCADIQRATRMAKKFVFYYGFSDVGGAGITTWANQPYSSDFLIGQQRARKVRGHVMGNGERAV